MKLIRWRCFVLVLALSALSLGCHGAAGSAGRLFPNLTLPTAGGSQVWADVAWSDGWRVQRHVWSGHARLLDDDDVRRGWGSEVACRELLRRETEARRAGLIHGPETRPVVVVLHGLWRTRDSMSILCEGLEAAGYEVVDVGYPSTQGSIAQHAEQVAGLLNSIEGEGREVSFVTHSLGALVTRALFDRMGDPWRTEHRLGRAVFIAAPHGGAALAQRASRIPGALTVYGAPSREIASGATLGLPAPPMPFLNIAASRGSTGGWNPLIPGDDDGVVAVEETRLRGEAGHLVVRGLHTTVMRSSRVVEAAVAFLQASS